MLRPSLCTCLLLATLVSPPARAGSPVRYALVVGNNHAGTAGQTPFPELKHAEAEARRTYRKLVTIGNFEPGRVRLLLGADRQAILNAARELSTLHQRDRQTLGAVDTLFAFFYSGHGLPGQLLTGQSALTAADLSAIFQQVGATFTVGVFDACYSGSFDLGRLRAKGIRPTPGFNPFKDLPREVLGSRGTMWFVSSHPDQPSYEDDTLGGVFTHFFLEGMEQARSDGIGVTLDDIWEYARDRTYRYTERGGRPQLPQKLVRELTATGPLYFSFPGKRSALLAFAPEIQGRFLIRYKGGQFAEVVTKRRGKEAAVPVYPSELTLERLDSHGRPTLRFAVEHGGTVRIEKTSSWQASASLGYRTARLRTKGTDPELVLSHTERRWSGLLEAGYGIDIAPELSGIPLHRVRGGARLVYGPVFLTGQVAYGQTSDDFEAWGYRASQIDFSVEGGWSFSLGRLRLGVGALAKLALHEVSFRNGEARDSKGAGLGPAACLLVPLWRGLLPGYLSFDVGLTVEHFLPVAPRDAEAVWRAVPWMGAGLAVAVF